MESNVLKHLHDIKQAALAITRFVRGKTLDDPKSRRYRGSCSFAGVVEETEAAVATNRDEVQQGIFPADEHCYH